MPLNLTRIDYSKLNAKQQENFNFAKLPALLADYGHTCIRLSDDHQGADLIVRHTDGFHVQLEENSYTITKVGPDVLEILAPYKL
jgi:hypothetical protein